MEMRDKVANAIAEKRHAQGVLCSVDWTVIADDYIYADAAIATVQEAEADTITTLRAELERAKIFGEESYQVDSEIINKLRAEVSALREGVIQECAQAALGAVFPIYSGGTDGNGNDIPGSPYDRGRYDAAAAIRALLETTKESGL